MADMEDIRRITLALPAVIEKGSAFEVEGKGFAWLYQQKIEGQRGRVERRDVLAIRVANIDRKEFLISTQPDLFFTDAHYNGYPAVLTRIAAIEPDQLNDLLTEAWRVRAPKRLAKALDASQTPE